jgi:hypothetical protein
MKLPKETIFKLHDEGYSNLQISEKTGLTVRQVLSFLNRNGRKSNKFPKLFNIKKLKQLILGSVLGDGCLEKIEGLTKTSRLIMGHSLKQLPYLKYKMDILNEYNLSGVVTICTSISNRYKEGKCTSYHTKSKSHPIFTYYRNLFYKDNIKLIHKEIEKINDFALAIWFMDDFCKTKNSYIICSHGFTVKDCNYLREILYQNFNIETTLHSNNSIYVRSCSVGTLNEIVKPHVIDCMKYKLKGPV